ncbi:MAG: DedA family protein [Thermodesulfobacteriota bacterium]|nr:DedA family protein [Thermodesulfobacteriota bacterium]
MVQPPVFNLNSWVVTMFYAQLSCRDVAIKNPFMYVYTMEIIVVWLVDTIGRLGYAGIMGLMFLESSFFPFPSEVIIPPAGYLAARAEMNIFWVIISGTLGSLSGALFNYFIAYFLGRPFLIRYGKYLFLTRDRLDKVDVFFRNHGEISTFIGRLITVVRQYISFPAGLAKMNLLRFCTYTMLGAGIWVSILAYIGYIVGNNMTLVRQYSKEAGIFLGIFIIFIVLIYYYVRIHRRRAP